jgi:hypothetical protein
MEEVKVPRDKVWAWLKSIGATKAIVEFSGGGDEGSIDDLEIFAGEGKIKPEITGYAWAGYGDSKSELTEDEIMGNALAQPIWDKYYTFAGEFHVHGTVTWNVEEGTVMMDGQESVEHYEGFEESV